MKSMKKQYGKKKGETVFYASRNKGVIKGVEKLKKEQKCKSLIKYKKLKLQSRVLKQILDTKTTADQAFNYIGTGGPEEEVQGQGAVLTEKKRNLKRTKLCGSVLLNLA